MHILAAATGRSRVPIIVRACYPRIPRGTDYFSNLVMCGMNKKACKPTHAAVEKKYFELYRGSRTQIEAEHDFEDVTDTVEDA